MSDLVARTMASLKYEQPRDGEQFLYAPFDSHSSLGRIDLITQRLYDCLPKGTVLYDIFGTRLVKGTDYIDEDAPYGVLGCGFISNREDRLSYNGPFRTE